MKKCAIVIGLGISLLIVISCNKKKSDLSGSDTIKTTVAVSDYFPLNTGNYWVYKTTQYDSSGNLIQQTFKNDSVVVKNDTVINSKTYHTVIEYNFLGSTTPNTQFYKDSADCVIDNNGEIIFSINSAAIIYSKILSPDTVAYVNYSYINTPITISVPIGTYNCVDFKGDVFRKIDNFDKAYSTHNYYSKNIGTIKKIELFVNSLYKINLELQLFYVH
jgi:hypothetical protein